jgi:hypothetical protein
MQESTAQPFLDSPFPNLERSSTYEYDEWLKWDRILRVAVAPYQAWMEQENHNPRRWRKIGFRVLSSQKDSKYLPDDSCTHHHFMHILAEGSRY